MSATSRTAGSVVIVGGGVIGLSVAFHLAEAGVRDLVVVERGTLGGGSSGKPIGGVRAQFSDPVNIALGLRSLRAYEGFAARPGGDIRLDRVGYLFLLSDPADLAAFGASVAVQNRMGVPSRVVGPARARELCPYVRTEGLVGAVYSPDDGHARPGLVVQGYARAAARAGARLRTGTTVTGVDVETGTTGGGRVTAVRTDRGVIPCSALVCAAGAWSAGIGDAVGVPLPVRPLRRQIALTRPPRPPRPPAPRIPFTIDFSSTAYFHNADGGGLLLGLADPGQQEGFDTTWTEDWVESFRDVARVRAPDIADLEVVDGWAGLYEVTPDCNALIGRAGDVSNFLYATGFSGHGFLQAPAVGEVVRDLYLGREPFVDVSPLSAGRFADGPVTGGRPEVHVV
ncbi:FAD-dependent oxidoreductase [Streptomyces sp. p1417]|uniref:FAD-dependent oxidoreductase n=1 Tax=Streptomyces typhae TaxID=2681492 RepID=A0A6L6WUQ4_9ACTN|nr:FAD-dependent oxidoreductase [Streptomyces typhae]